MKKLFFLSIVSAVCTVSCTKDALVGTGEIKTEVRVLNQFDKVQISGNREAVIIKSEERKVELTGYANLVDRYSEKLKNGNLSFEYPAFTRVRNDNVKLKIYTPDLAMVGLSGNTRLTIGEGFSSDRLELQLSGNTFVEGGTGTVNVLRIDASGNPDILLKSVIAREADLHLSGNPEVEVFAEQKLSVNASGTGKIKYWGSPATSIKVSGTVKVERQ